ncbi:DUF2897 family protein [Shewanella dokdonensis]|uniref:DUF2897 family protein n=1 Tax=Shewanella dokdonensis TaxID=712036 RepID=A0ABX8DE09_9GAMM|nr:DUF2897 family protein [Shewanella dokdonensis]
MSDWEVWLIILLVIGVIFSNLAVLKYSSKFKLPPFGQPQKPANKQKDTADKQEDDQEKS